MVLVLPRPDVDNFHDCFAWADASKPYGQKTGPRHCPEQELIALRLLIIDQTWEVPCEGGIPCILNICADCESIARCRFDFMPLPSRNTSAGRQGVVDAALLPCSFLPPSVKETRSGCLCLDGCAPCGNAANIAARLAAATILQPGSASTDILL